MTIGKPVKGPRPKLPRMRWNGYPPDVARTTLSSILVLADRKVRAISLPEMATKTCIVRLSNTIHMSSQEWAGRAAFESQIRQSKTNEESLCVHFEQVKIWPTMQKDTSTVGAICGLFKTKEPEWRMKNRKRSVGRRKQTTLERPIALESRRNCISGKTKSKNPSQ